MTTPKLPGEMSPKAVTLNIGEQMAECMRPLPRNREIAWEVRAEGAQGKESNGH